MKIDQGCRGFLPTHHRRSGKTTNMRRRRRPTQKLPFAILMEKQEPQTKRSAAARPSTGSQRERKTEAEAMMVKLEQALFSLER